jgi:hypothetical protein
MTVRERVGMGNHNDPKEGRKADKKGPMSNTGKITIAMGIHENRTVQARGGQKAGENVAFTGVLLRVFAEGSSKELMRERFRGSGGIDSVDGVGEEGGGNGGEGLVLIVIETDEQPHALLLNKAVKELTRELKGLRHLGVQFLVFKNNRPTVDAKIVTAKPRGFSVASIENPKGKPLPKKDGEFVRVEFDTRGGWKVLR